MIDQKFFALHGHNLGIIGQNVKQILRGQTSKLLKKLAPLA